MIFAVVFMVWMCRVILVIVIFRVDAMMFCFFHNNFYLTDPSEILTQ